MINILVVEDNLDLREMLCSTLNHNGYQSYGASDGLSALDIIEKNVIDLIICDIMMPKMDGYEFTRAIRGIKNNTPILMVTAKEDYESMQKGFNLGVDDYMVKPINIKEMLLRINALLRRAKINAERKIVIGNTILDNDSMTITVKNETIILPLKEFNLLYKLLSYPNKIFTRQQIMDEIWGLDSDSDDRTINTHINRLREKFIDNEDFEIITIRGLGYKAVKKNG